jgi:hypothetical protein
MVTAGPCAAITVASAPMALAKAHCLIFIF